MRVVSSQSQAVTTNLEDEERKGEEAEQFLTEIQSEPKSPDVIGAHVSNHDLIRKCSDVSMYRENNTYS